MHQSQLCLSPSRAPHEVTGQDNSASLSLCEGDSPVTGGFPSQRVSNAKGNGVSLSVWSYRVIMVLVYIVDAMKYTHGFVVLCFVVVIVRDPGRFEFFFFSSGPLEHLHMDEIKREPSAHPLQDHLLLQWRNVSVMMFQTLMFVQQLAQSNSMQNIKIVQYLTFVRPIGGWFPSQMISNTDRNSMPRCHHDGGWSL